MTHPRDENDPGGDATPHSPGGGTAAPAFSNAALVVFGLAALLFVLLRLWRLTSSCLWFDEIFSVHAAARHGWKDMLAFVVEDIIHPPLFYALLKIWIAAGGESLLWVRLFPALTSIATIFPFFLLCRELRLKAGEMNLALALMAANGYLIKYAQELRMYSLLLLFTLCSLWLFAAYCNARGASKKKLAALFAVNLLLVYTHYYGWLVVAAEGLFLLFRARRKLLPFSIVSAALALCFAPWAYAVARAAAGSVGLAQNIGWMARPALADAARFYVTLNEILYYRQSSHEPLFFRWSAPLCALVFGGPLLVFLWRVWRRPPVDDRERANVVWWALAFTLLPVALALAASWLLPYSVWGTRHLIVIAAPY
ncbi:MAG: glycosyltransferase family 39 protein, partial [Pyrinomonadaceae bacterium]